METSPPDKEPGTAGSGTETVMDLRSHVAGAPEHAFGEGTEAMSVDATSPANAPENSVGAKYKLRSPAELPISRSPCKFTIPPGLSPTSFLESPVLLSNIKAEPSPTTGTFFLPKFMQGPSEAAAFSMTGNCSTVATFDKNKSKSFEFQFHTGYNAATGPPVSMSSAGAKLQNDETPAHVPHDNLPPSSPLSSSIKCELAMPKEFSAPVILAGTTAAVDSDLWNNGVQQKSGIEVSYSENKDKLSSVSNERSSEDGYNWRKYGQKLVKGSEFPRSYYKCTYPNCEVRKIFERAPDGEIKEIVYKGSHDHPKPQPNRRFTPGAPAIQEEKLGTDPYFSAAQDNTNNNGQTCNMELCGTPVLSPRQESDDGLDATLQLQRVNDETDDDDPFSKKRKLDGTMDITSVLKPIREPRVVVQTVSEVDILDDGYRWRKYGQKVVRGNPNPRSYYKCTNAGCQVRKHVERASHDIKAVITTYEGKHNHDVPAARTSSHEMAASSPRSGISRIRSDENDSSTLNLGVGMSNGPEHRTNGQVNQLESEPAQGQVQVNGRMMLQVPPFLACYGAANGGFTLFGSRVEGGGLETTALQTSNQCAPNLGRILLGP